MENTLAYDKFFIFLFFQLKFYNVGQEPDIEHFNFFSIESKNILFFNFSQGARKLKGDNLNVFRAEFSILS